MMDHARHLSSPSPTSPFLFHHSDRPCKSHNPLNPLLSSTVVNDMTNVDDCFSTNPSNLHNHHHHSFGLDIHHHNHHNHHHHQQLLVENHHNHLNGQTSNNSNTSNQQQQQQQQNRDSCVVIDQDSLTGVDDDDGMHNMLSGSSTSSTSTMPLLTGSHSHHSFSRISLEEYSPLSLVEDCDNALPISPTSLACGSHHSFKSSLNGLKMDSGLVGDEHDVVHDDVNDARSLSPSLLSSSISHNLWSNSSTAITQNTSLLNSTSTSFLLSHHHHHHHHHQLNSLIQQLEPQSLDEAPPLVNSNNNFSETQNLIGSNGILSTLHRPSSEPPLDLGGGHNEASGLKLETYDAGTATAPSTNRPSGQNRSLQSRVNSKSGKCTGGDSNESPSSSSTTTTTTTTTITNSSSTSAVIASSSSSRSRKSRNRSSGVSAKQSEVNSNNSGHSKQSFDQQDKKQQATICDKSVDASCQPVEHSSKVHLQLNHREKLLELQQRLFGTAPSASTDGQALKNNKTSKEIGLDTDTSEASTITSNKNEEPDSSASGSSNKSSEKLSTTGILDAANEVAPNQRPSMATTNGPSSKATKSRPTRSRRSRTSKKEAVTSETSSSPSGTTTTTKGSTRSQKTVTTETAEPDTTTKSSDCIKLTDLLSNSSSSSSNNNNNNNNSNNNNNNNNNEVKSTNAFIIEGFATTSETASETGDATGTSTTTNTTTTINGNSGGGNGGSGAEKRLQQIQLQVSPSLTVVAANGGLVQPISLQQQQGVNGSSVGISTASGGTATAFANPILCRPQTVMATTSGQFKSLMSSNELLKSGIGGGDNILANWSLQPQATNINNNNNTNGNNTNNGSGSSATNNNANGQTIGAHHIAIQVICQDGTSLVLPVSSAASLNAAVSLTTQHQQLQAVLANNAAVQQHRGNQQNHLLPLMSVSNIVAQQVNGGGNNNNGNNSTETSGTSNSSTSQNSSTQTSSGLAASSPTLAALLDAGSSRNTTVNSNNDLSNFSGQNLVSTNLLRKLVSSSEFKRGELTLQQGSTLSLSNCGSLLTVCAPASTQSSQAKTMNKTVTTTNLIGNNSSSSSTSSSSSSSSSGEKRIKLETSAADSNSVGNTNTNSNNITGFQTTLTLIDPHGLLVTNSNTDGNKRIQTSNNNANNNGATTGAKTSGEIVKQSKMSSSTGNRQVDPTQPFRCEHCNSTFTRLGNFTRHKKIHTVPTKDGQRFKCDVCNKSFLQRCDLARHLHIHRGTEPHRCNICGKGYIRHSDLVTHQRFHNKEKPFGCPHCSKGFCQRGDLNRHLRSIHLQMKPILCPCCNRKFAKQETLLRHLNTAHRSKSGTTTGTNASVVAELPAIPVVNNPSTTTTTIAAAAITTTTTNNTSNNAQRKAPVASLQAIQATLCKVPQSSTTSVDPKIEPTSSESSSPVVIAASQDAEAS